MLQRRQSSQSKGLIETPGIKQNLQSNAHLWPWEKYLLSRGSISVIIQKDLESTGIISRVFLCDLTSKGDSFQRSQPDLKSQAGIEAKGTRILQSGGHLWPWDRNLQSQGFIEQEEFVAPATVVERIDFRAQFPKRPIARLKVEIPVPANYEKFYAAIELNAVIHQIAMVVPDLGGATFKIQLLDEGGTVLYESASQNDDQRISVLLTTGVPIVGKPSIGLLLGAVQASRKDFTIMLYGR